MIRPLFTALALLLAPAACLAQQTRQAAAAGSPDADAKIAEARAAAPPSITDRATFVDWDGTVLREGTNGWTCMPSPPGFRETPMCLDGPWVAWAQAWQSRAPVHINRVGIGYMMVGDAGASNTDPFATAPVPGNEWVVSGPHLMVITPNLDDMKPLPTDPENGGPWVMWQGTPYAHVMIPIGSRPTR